MPHDLSLCTYAVIAEGKLKLKTSIEEELDVSLSNQSCRSNYILDCDWLPVCLTSDDFVSFSANRLVLLVNYVAREKQGETFKMQAIHALAVY